MNDKVKILKLYNGKVAWFVFNVYGLKLNKSINWQQFLFHDSTVVNIENLSEYLRNELNYSKDDFLFQLNKDADSYLIVHIGGAITKENENEKIKLAKQRANEIISLIYFSFLYLTNSSFGISLDFELTQTSGGTFSYFTSNREISHTQQHTKGEFWIQCPTPPYQMSRESLMRILKKEYFNLFFEVIIKKKGAFYQVLSNSLTNFYRTTNTQSPMTQFVGSVTSTEILLKKQVDRYDLIKERIFVILGEKFYNDYIEDNENISGIFNLRNNIVHDGQFCYDYDAGRAIRLFSEILIAYSHFCNQFSSKDELCHYLDIIFKHLKNSNNLYTKDPFNILQKWYKIKYSISNIDDVPLYLISYYSLNHSQIKDEAKSNFISAVYCFSKLRKIKLETAYKHLYNHLIYKKVGYDNFEEFEKLFEDNKQKHKDSYNLLIKFTKFNL